MWDLPGAGIEPVPSALAGGFLTTMPPGKSPCILLNINYTAVFKSISSAPGLSLTLSIDKFFNSFDCIGSLLCSGFSCSKWDLTSQTRD